MDRDSIVRIINESIKGSYNGQDVHDVIYEFCMEKDSSKVDLIEQCIAIILQQGAGKSYFDKALDHFKIKFSVNEVYDVEKPQGSDLFGRPIMSRTLLQAY